MKGCLLVAGNLVEAGLYQIAYFCVGFCLCSIPEKIVGAFNKEDSPTEVVLETCLQVALTGMCAEIVRYIVKNIVPDIGNDQAALQSMGGGVIFATTMWSRQPSIRQRISFLHEHCQSEYN